MNRRFFHWLYFLAQRWRGGVTPDMVSRADEILRCRWSSILQYVDERMQQVHGEAMRSGESGWEWLARQRPEAKAEARHRMEDAAQGVKSRDVEWRRTSGSTGMPVSFAKDRTMTAWMDAAMWAAYGWHGVRPGQRHARFWGLPRDPWKRARRRLMDRLLNRHRMDAFDLSPDASRSFFRRLQGFEPEYIHAYPTLLRTFVEQCAALNLDGRDLGVRVVICGGELLVDQTRRAISDFFGCPVVDEYGCTESGLLTLECEEGNPHVLPVACFPEVLSPAGAALTEGTGEVVVTDLYGTVAPLVRYRLSDQARIRASDCNCGRELPILAPEMGRSQDFIVTSSGKRYATILAYTVPDGISRFRAYQIDEKLLVAEVVLAADAGASSLKALRTRWASELEGVTVRLTTVPEIAPEPSGKLRYFVPMSDVPSDKVAELLAATETAGRS